MWVVPNDIPDQLALFPSRFGVGHAWRGDGQCIVTVVWKVQVTQQKSAVGMWIGAHATCPAWRQISQFGHESTCGIKQFLRTIAFQPGLQKRDMRGLTHIRHRHLMGAECTGAGFAIDLWRSRPALGRPQDDHGPTLSPLEPVGAGVMLNLTNAGNRSIQRFRHLLVHRYRILSFHEPGCIAVTDEQRFKLVMRDPRQHGWTSDLVSVQVQDRQHGPIVHGIEKLVGVPAGG